jgi:thioredoxin reductase (NADPH)
VVAATGALEHIELADRATETAEDVPSDALFIMIGCEPHTQWLPEEIVRDQQGYILTGRDLVEQPSAPRAHHWDPLTLETSLPGVSPPGMPAAVRSSASPRR